jgi:hypothetical protein
LGQVHGVDLLSGQGQISLIFGKYVL